MSAVNNSTASKRLSSAVDIGKENPNNTALTQAVFRFKLIKSELVIIDISLWGGDSKIDYTLNFQAVFYVYWVVIGSVPGLTLWRG
jgi:hypothetical protein